MLSGEEKVVFFGVFPLFLVLLGILVPQVWRGRRDAYDAATLVHVVIGESGRSGFNAFLPVAYLSAVALYSAVMLEVVHDVVVDEAVSAWHWAAGFAFLGAILTMLVAFNVLLFLRPWFLVPPHLKGERGWIPGAFHERRERRRES